jgi:hypothetical protein
MVFAVRCPNPQCRKYMLVEDHDRGKAVHCLVCKQPIRVPAEVPPQPSADLPNLRITVPRTDPRP